MSYVEKSRMSFQDRMTKQNEISRQILVRELSKLDESEKQDLRMLDTARQRFRSRFKKLGVGRVTLSGAEAIDVRMYETHNPGFCYHCNGAIKESVSILPSEQILNSDDSYEFIRRMLFTNGEVDIEKLLCLHVLAAHTSKNIDGQLPAFENNSSLPSNEGKHLSGAWNNYLPCYVVEITSDHHKIMDYEKLGSKVDEIRKENDTIRDFEVSYKNYARDNADVVRSLVTTQKMASRTLGKMPIISPHVYTILGSSHELRVKRSLAEGFVGKNATIMPPNKHRSSSDATLLDCNLKKDVFRLFDDAAARDVTDRAKYGACAKDRACADLTKISAQQRRAAALSCFRDISRGSSSEDRKIDSSITMLKGKFRKNFIDGHETLMKNWRSNEMTSSTINENSARNELITIKPSFTNHRYSGSKNSVGKTDYHSFRNNRGTRSSGNSYDFITIKPSFTNHRYSGYKNSVGKTDFYSLRNDRGTLSPGNSYDFTIDSPRSTRIQYRRCVYLNSPIKCFAMKNREYRTVDILVNNQIQALVHSVLEILERVNPDKVRKMCKMAQDESKICDIFRNKETQSFVESLIGQPIVTSRESFVLSRAIAIDEIDSRLENSVDDELIALTLELPPLPGLGLLVDEIRNNVFANVEKKCDSSMELLNDRQIINVEGISGEEETKVDMVDVIKCKAEPNIETHDGSNEKSRETIEVIDKFDKVQGKLENVNSEINRSKVTKSPANKRPRDKEIIDEFDISKSRLMNDKYQSKPQKINLDVGYLDPDRVILRRMTNSQRIMVGRMCAALKNRKINNEGLIRERTPLAALITPVLSRESINTLTRGTYYSKFTESTKLGEDKEEKTAVIRSEKLTGPVLAKVRRDIAEYETKRRLDAFFAN